MPQRKCHRRMGSVPGTKIATTVRCWRVSGARWPAPGARSVCLGRDRRSDSVSRGARWGADGRVCSGAWWCEFADMCTTVYSSLLLAFFTVTLTISVSTLRNRPRSNPNLISLGKFITHIDIKYYIWIIYIIVIYIFFNNNYLIYSVVN